jgi:hypothetical protein
LFDDEEEEQRMPSLNTKGTPKVLTKIKPEKEKIQPPVPPKTQKGMRDTRDHYLVLRHFLDGLARRRCPIYVGIDCGKQGAIGLLDPERSGNCDAIDIPVISANRKTKTKKGNPRKKTLFDEAMIWEMVQLMLPFKDRIVIVIEEGAVRETDGGRTGFSVGYGYGMWPLFLTSHGFTVELALPSVWKVKMGLAGKSKEWSRLIAQRLWPNAMLLRKGDDGRAEALLVAEYQRRKRSG